MRKNDYRGFFNFWNDISFYVKQPLDFVEINGTYQIPEEIPEVNVPSSWAVYDAEVRRRKEKQNARQS